MMYMAPYHGAEARMYNMSLVHNPDHEQVLEHHKELLKKAQQERLAQEALKAQRSEHPSFHPLEFLRHLFVRRRSRDFARTVSHPSVHT